MSNSQRRNSYTFKEGLTMMAAKAVGIDPDLAAEAGDGAGAAINALRRASKAKYGRERAGFIREAQAELRTINASKHPKVVNAIQARLLALQGRGGDTEIAHVTPGEVVIPRRLQTPAVMRALAAEAQRQGINTARLSVGNPANSRNPRTGQREFIEEITVTGTRGGGSRGSAWVGGGAGFFSNRAGYDSNEGNSGGADLPYEPSPEDDPNIPAIELPPGGYDKLIEKGWQFDGKHLVSPQGQKITYIETVTVTAPRVTSGNVNPSLLLRINADSSTTGNYKVPDGYWDEALKQMGKFLDEVLSNLTNATNQELYQAYTNAKHLEASADNVLYRAIGLAYGLATESDSFQSAQKPLRDFYSIKADKILNEIKDRIENGTWDIGGLPSWPPSNDLIAPM